MALKEMYNNVEVRGLIKSLSLEDATTKKGREDIQGNAVIEVTDKNNHVNNIKINVFAFKNKKDGSLSKLYKGLDTVRNEYKTIDDDGRENAYFVTVTGNLDSNIYMSHGNLRTSNRIRGVFFTHEDNKTLSQHAFGKMGVIIKSIQPATDADGNSLGYHNVSAYSAGYNNNVIPLFNLIIKDGKMEEQFEDIYAPGTFGKISFSINNYAKESEKKNESEAHGFGEDVELSNEKNVDYINNLEIIGGEQPNYDKQFEPSDLKELVRQYLELVNEAKENDSGNSFEKDFSKPNENAKSDTDAAMDKMLGSKDESTNNTKSDKKEESDEDLNSFLDNI